MSACLTCRRPQVQILPGAPRFRGLYARYCRASAGIFICEAAPYFWRTLPLARKLAFQASKGGSKPPCATKFRCGVRTDTSSPYGETKNRPRDCSQRIRAVSSVGRALLSHGRGRKSKSSTAHRFWSTIVGSAALVVVARDLAKVRARVRFPHAAPSSTGAVQAGLKIAPDSGTTLCESG